MEIRNAYLTTRAMRSFLIASVLTMVINQLNTTVDGIIVSHLIGPDALSAVTLYLPVNLVVNALGTLLAIGATIIASKAIGRRDKEAVSGILSTAFASLVIAGFVLAVAGFCFGHEIAGWRTDDARLRGQLSAYLTVMLGCGIVPMLNLFLSQCVDIDGFPLKVTKAMTLTLVCNIFLDLLLVGAFGMGIRGSAVATIMSYVVAILFYGSHLMGPQSDIRFRFQVSSFRKYIGENLIQGLPLLIGNVILVVLFYSMNSIVQGRLGRDGMFVLSVCVNIFMIGMMLSNGFGSTILSLGGFLYGQSDFMSVRFLVKRCLLAILVITVGLCVVVEVAPSVLTRLFGANTPELEAMANGGVRIFIICLVPFCLVLTLANLYQMLGRVALSPILVLSFPAVLLSSMLLFAGHAEDSLLWYAFPVSGVLVFGFAAVVAEVIRRTSRREKLTPLTLLPIENKHRVYEVSLKNTMEAFREAIGKLVEVVEPFELDEATSRQVVISTEELLLNTIQHSGIEGNGCYSDLRMVETEKSFTVSMKYEGRPFNPLSLAEEERRFGLRILFGNTKNVDYKYMYGQNMMYLSWETETNDELRMTNDEN